jgi:pimeloyl-ACP methyl ester carboxylesterase
VGAYVLVRDTSVLRYPKGRWWGTPWGALLAFAISTPTSVGIIPGGGVKMPVNPAILEGVQKDPAAILAFTAKIAVAKKNRERLAPILAKRTPDPEVLYGDFLACDRLDLSGEIGSIRTPTLIVCGSEDKMTPPALSESLREMIPGARLALIPEAGHLVMMEDPEGFNEALRSFVAELDGRK